MIKGVSHIGIVVKDIEASVSALCKAFGMPLPEIEYIAERKTKMAQVWFGSVSLEFVQDDSEEGMMGKFQREKGDAIHHFCVVSDDIDGEIEMVKQRGIAMLHPRPYRGLRGKRIAYLMPGDLGGLHVELTEP